MRDAERYSIIVKIVDVDGESLYRATAVELPDLAEFAETREEVTDLILEAIEGLKSEAKAEGRAFPEPLSESELEYSGRVTLRLPRTVHRFVAEQADIEGVSLNAYIISALSVSLSEKTRAAKPLAPKVADAEAIGVAGTTISYGLGVGEPIFLSREVTAVGTARSIHMKTSPTPHLQLITSNDVPVERRRSSNG